MSELAPQRIQDRPFVAMFTAPNPGPKTLTGTHSYVMGRSPGYVIDPGPADEQYQQELAAWLGKSELTVEGILLTHGHPDHAPGAALLKGLVPAPVWASPDMPETRRREAAVDRLFSAGTGFELESDLLQVLSSPGHTSDHVAFWLQNSRILFAGDTILGEGTSLIAPPEGDMVTYMETLERFTQLQPRLIAPGHGSIVTNPDAKLSEYLEHRKQREQQVLAALRSGPITIHELVQLIYTDVDPRLHDLASGSVEAQLQKLIHEGRVRAVNGSFRLEP